MPITKGPWTYGYDHFDEIGFGELVWFVATEIGVIHVKNQEQAMLISSAPELLEVVKGFVLGHESWRWLSRTNKPLLKKMEALIKKAEGTE